MLPSSGRVAHVRKIRHVAARVVSPRAEPHRLSSGMRRPIRASSPRLKAGAIPVAASLNATTRPSRSSTIAAPGKSADDLLDQLSLRIADDLLGRARDGSTADDCRRTEQSIPRTAQSARQAVGGGDIATVVFNRHGQSASGFRSPSSLRIGAVTDVISSGFLGRRAPLKFSQSSRVPSIVNANANGTM